MLPSEMRACDILHQDQPKRKLRTAIEKHTQQTTTHSKQYTAE